MCNLIIKEFFYLCLLAHDTTGMIVIDESLYNSEAIYLF